MEWRKSGKLICTIHLSSLLSLSLSFFQNLSFAVVVAHGKFFEKHKERDYERKLKRQGSSLK
jgi:hypothetical protein